MSLPPVLQRRNSVMERSVIVDNLVTFVQKQGQEKAVRQAFYNTAAVIFLMLTAGIGVIVYFVLEIFLRPLLWAVLSGTALYPLKFKLTTLAREWLIHQRDTETPLVIGCGMVPVDAANCLSELVISQFSRKYKLCLGIAASFLLLFVLHSFALHHALLWLFQFILGLFAVFVYVVTSAWMWTFILGYIGLVIFFWDWQPLQKFLTAFSLPLWLAIFFQFAKLFGVLTIPICGAAILLSTIGLAVELKHGNLLATSRHAHAISVSARDLFSLLSATDEPPVTDDDDQVDASRESAVFETTTTQTVKKPSRIYFELLLTACGLVQLWKHCWILQTIPIFILLYSIKKLLNVLYIRDRFNQRTRHQQLRCRDWFHSREDALFPRPLKAILRLLRQGDAKLVNVLIDVIDKLVSVVVILILVIGFVLITTVVLLQVHQETVVVAKVTVNLINETSVTYPEVVSHWLPVNADANVKNAMETFVDNAYVHGRAWIAGKVRGFLHEHGKSDDISAQVLEIWDRLYETWNTRHAVGISSHRNATEDIEGISGNDTISRQLNQLWVNFGPYHAYEIAASFARDNVEVIYSVLESIWAILRANTNLIFSILSGSVSLVVLGGGALLNFALSTVVFGTTVFYLLAASDDQYIGIKWIVDLLPEVGNAETRFADTVAGAIRSVFGASLKMASFYGLYTWLTHTLFGASIVFIPCALASLVAVCPFLGTYWVCIPACLELWLIQGRGGLALALCASHMLPWYLVDTAIYADISGGSHPYLTGLSVVGGIYWFGLEGAIIGPIVLCCLLVAVKLYGAIIHDVDGYDPLLPAFQSPLKSLLSRSRSSEAGINAGSQDVGASGSA